MNHSLDMKVLVCASSEGLVYVKRVSEPRRVQVHRRADTAGAALAEGTVDTVSVDSGQRLLLLKVNAANNLVAICMENENPFIYGLLADGRFTNRTPISVLVQEQVKSTAISD